MPSFTERSMWFLFIYIQEAGELGHMPRLGVHTKRAGVSPRHKIFFLVIVTICIYILVLITVVLVVV